jgi:hypothetical protein
MILARPRKLHIELAELVPIYSLQAKKNTTLIKNPVPVPFSMNFGLMMD